ncbi:MAG: 30S ribosomal protein S2 [Candidatus Lindowbacteria bacterium RIFCSPLOWO2_12_FULL_62_27]|nr:MAG: 30S ribosomal protein S2 [Candidatus Lindowbacteria bacterium RIFCSPLOWO2_12_FULL_62_27]OGH63697.1 MAG: 30S ribosomal protein S2 [Candidatus Lindowbacteria bacterium RIFCSPLOWO2_02_FULL_62_12]
MVRIAMKQLLEAGAHFGHQTRRWNPKMTPYIYTKRKNIHIIDLQQTLRIFRDVLAKVTEVASTGARFLFVGTKKQAAEAVEREAKRCGMFYVSTRWLGGMLTNYTTISKSIDKMKRMESMEADGTVGRMGNKEAKRFRKELERLRGLLLGIRDMSRLPDMIVVIDMKRELTSVQEAQKLGVPVLGILDTNCDPDWATYGIPGNDDAIRAIALYLKTIADAILEGQAIYQQKVMEAEKAAADAAAAAANVDKPGESAPQAAAPTPAAVPAPVAPAPAPAAPAPAAPTPAEPVAAAASPFAPIAGVSEK